MLPRQIWKILKDDPTVALMAYRAVVDATKTIEHYEIRGVALEISGYSVSKDRSKVALRTNSPKIERTDNPQMGVIHNHQVAMSRSQSMRLLYLDVIDFRDTEELTLFVTRLPTVKPASQITQITEDVESGNLRLLRVLKMTVPQYRE